MTISMAGGVAAHVRKAPAKNATRLRAFVPLIYPSPIGMESPCLVPAVSLSTAARLV